MIRKAKPFRSSRTDNGRVFPGKFGQRLGQFLEPAVVGESAVPDRGIWTEGDFERIRSRRQRRGVRHRVSKGPSYFARFGSGLRHQSVMQSLLPAFFKALIAKPAFPILSDDFMRGQFRVALKGAQYLVRCA